MLKKFVGEKSGRGESWGNVTET